MAVRSCSGSHLLLSYVVLLIAVLSCGSSIKYAAALTQARLPATAVTPLPVTDQVNPTAVLASTHEAAGATPAAPLRGARPTASSRLPSAAAAAVKGSTQMPEAAAKAETAAVKPDDTQPIRPAAAIPAKKPRPGLPTAPPRKAAAPGRAATQPRQTAAPVATAPKAGTPHVTEGLPAAIPLPLLLGDAKHSNPQLSMDGRYVAYIKPAPATGVSNVFIRKLPAPGDRPALSDGFEDAPSIFDRSGADTDRQITFDTHQGVSAYSWSEDSDKIYFIQDQDGDENYHLFMSSIDKPGEAINLTPFPGVKADGIISNEHFPDKLLFGLNRRDASIFDLYSLDTNTLELSLVMINPGDVSSWEMDYEFNIRGVVGYNNTDGSSYVLINDALPRVTAKTTAAKVRAAKQAASKSRPLKTQPKQAQVKTLEALFDRAEKEKWGLAEWVQASSSKADVSKWRRLLTWPFGDEGSVFKFNKAGDAMYIVSSTGRDTTEFQLISTAPGAKVLQRIASNPLANINSVEFDIKTWEPQIVSFEYLKVQWTLLDQSLQPDWKRIVALRPDDEVVIVSRSSDDTVWLLGYTSDSVNCKYYLHRRGSWPPELLFDTQPGLLPYTVSKMHPVVIKARDGLTLPSYLSLPVRPNIPTTLPKCVTGHVPDLTGQLTTKKTALERSPVSSDCKLDLNIPLVLMVHGGPWSRDTWGADPAVQLLTNRGYAVLQVNYRGSTGYGKRFLNLGNKQWGIGSMQHDLSDAVQWAVNKGIADPNKVCIMGGSYGGYASLAGLTFTPDLYACAISLVGISNPGTFMRSIPPYWKPLHFEWLERVGPADRDEAFNRKISPLYHVDNIKAPLLLAQGAHDPRVPQAESDQMFKAMHTRGLPVKYVLYTDEGHGVSRPENKQDYYSRVEQFLAEHLGGRAEAPISPEGASVVVIKDLADLAAMADYANKDDDSRGPVPPAANTATPVRQAAAAAG